MQSGVVGNFDGRIRDEMITETMFGNLTQARGVIPARAADGTMATAAVGSVLCPLRPTTRGP